MPDSSTMIALIIAAGVAQFAIAAVSLGLPHVLKWRKEFAKLQPLNRHIFWVYSAYIFGTNVAIAALSTFAPDWLLDGSMLAIAVAGYITLYWGARLFIQIFSYRGADIPQGIQYRLADVLFTLVFGYLTVVYGMAVASTCGMCGL